MNIEAFSGTVQALFVTVCIIDSSPTNPRVPGLRIFMTYPLSFAFCFDVDPHMANFLTRGTCHPLKRALLSRAF